MRTYPWQWTPNLYSDHYLLSEISEEKVQEWVLDFLAAEHIKAFPADAGAKAVRGHVYRQLKAACVRNAGVVVAGGRGAAYAGVTDIAGTMPGGRSLYIEVKAPAWYRLNNKNELRVKRAAGLPTEDQLAFMDTMHEQGALVGVVWSPQDAADLIGGAR